MQAAGNLVTVPGQDNFVEDFTRVTSVGNADVDVNLTAAHTAKRSANAMVIDIMPYFGSLNTDVTRAWLSPVRAAALNLKQYVDTSFGTNTDYDPQDLMVYLMAVSAVFPVIAELKRDIRLINTFQSGQYPAFLPRGMFAALQIPDGEGSYAHGEGALYCAERMRSYIDRLNQIIISFNRLPIPPEILAFQYNDDLFDALWADTADIRTAQIYAFRTCGCWMYNEEVDGAPGARLEFKPYPNQSIYFRLSTLAQQVEKLTALRTSSTAMLQNLFNAYGSVDTLQVPTVDMLTLMPLDVIYSPDILTMVENMVVCGWDKIEVSHIQADAATNDINGHIWIPSPVGAELYFNLPLQFHKPAAEITENDIGWALRMHPAFLSQKKFKAYTTEHPAGVDLSHVTSDGYTGFAICTDIHIVRFKDDGSISNDMLDSRRLTASTYSHLMNTLDFSTAPLFVDFEDVTPTGATVFTYKLNWYSARRDVELTYRREDMQMHWTYLTQTLWAGNVNRNVTGTRTR